jgi:hypothetical protein
MLLSTTTTRASESEVTILARILGNEHGQLPHALAGSILKLGFSDRDKVRMHGLWVSNPDDALSRTEKSERFAFAKGGDLLSIHKSKAHAYPASSPKKGTNS